MKKIIILILVLSLAGFWFIYGKKNYQTQNTNSVTEKSKEILAESINGVLVEPVKAGQRPVAIMVENHPDARPQSGLSAADVVYEALAEGGITRFLAVFQNNDASVIGPVRSAREYFAQLADEWAALYVHVGGSNEVISQLKKGQYQNLSDANEYTNGDFFVRSKVKPQPHHIFTSIKNMRELISLHNYSNQANFKPWLFKQDNPATATPVSVISIDFSRPGYEVSWQYDAVTNSYKRLQYFQPHMDEASKSQITAKNVVLEIVQVTPVPNDKLLQVDIDLQSGGKALMFLDGKVITGTWKKQANKTRYYDSGGKEVLFNRGPIWVELVPQAKESNLSWK